jgi:hypothetical protein
MVEAATSTAMTATATAATCGASLSAAAIVKARDLVAIVAVVVMALGHQAPRPTPQLRQRCQRYSPYRRGSSLVQQRLFCTLMRRWYRPATT